MIIPNKKLRLFIPWEEIEGSAQAQLNETASMPFVLSVAVMPDVHYGKGSTVGSVVVTDGAIMPACVGVDIGCGMHAYKTGYRALDLLPHVADIRKKIEEKVPVGIGPRGRNSTFTISAVSRIAGLEEYATILWGGDSRASQRYDKYDGYWREALGTLGGGNHFIEICSDDEGWAWIILHSGSRGIGNKIGTSWINRAKATADKYYYTMYLPNKDLAYIPNESSEFNEYWKDVKWAQRFAMLNRDEMFGRILSILTALPLDSAIDYDPNHVIRCHHNYIAVEEWMGKKVMVTRKGAIAAYRGMRALIPGSMGTNSYIVEGLGNPNSFCSAPHGAGRRMSRGEAKKTFTVDGLREFMQQKEIEANVRESIVDEHPLAYKDIHQTMSYASGLIMPITELSQILNVKGD